MNEQKESLMHEISDLPHKKPMLLIDRLLKQSDGYALAEMDCPSEAFYFQGHFPGQPVVPGVILVEACAQTSAFALPDAAPQKVFYLTSVNKVKFSRPVVPGNIVTLESAHLRSRRGFHWFQITAYVGKNICMQGEISVFAQKD